MFEEGNLLYFAPFIFKNGASPKPKFFVVLKHMADDLLLASLPTSKDYVPGDMKFQQGCIDVEGRRLNIFVFLAGEEIISSTATQEAFSFSKNTFIYGSDLDTYPIEAFDEQMLLGQTSIEVKGKLKSEVFQAVTECLRNSKMVKNKFRKML